MKIYLVICVAVMYLFPATINARTGNPKQTLTALFGKLSAKYDVHISFSPSLTDKVYPDGTNTDGEFEEALARILKGTDFVFRRIDDRHYYIIMVEPVRKIPKQSAEQNPSPKEKRPDTIRQPVLPLPVPVIPIPSAGLAKMSLPVIPPSDFTKSRNTILAIKTNLLYDMTLTINWGIEMGLGKRTSLDISGNYNSWTYADYRKMKHWLVQPEFRYWTCSRFSGGFWGIHAHYAQFNWGNIMPFTNKRYEGWLAGGGIGYGYHWILGKRFGIEAEIGIGYTRLKFDKFQCGKCGDKLNSGSKHYFGPTKAAINLIWMIK